MVRYLKENGFPIDLIIETSQEEDEEENWKGWKSIITVDGFIIDTIYHNDYRSRVFWAGGFFKGLEYKTLEKDDWIENYSGAQL
jgi:hypothetical protein